jgi:hypothetical protein
MRRFFFMFVAAAMVALVSPVAQATPQIPIYFVGDWCFEAQDGQTISFLLPSWSEKGACRKILSVTPHEFFGAGHHCDPVEEARISLDAAPSGEVYTATITARCWPDGPASDGKIRTIEFRRYKGNLQVTPRG